MRTWRKTWKHRLMRLERMLLRERTALMRTRRTLRLGRGLEGGICWEDGGLVGRDPRLYLLHLLDPCRSPQLSHRLLGLACHLRACFRSPKSIGPIDPPLDVIQEVGAFQERLIVLQSSKGSGRSSPLRSYELFEHRWSSETLFPASGGIYNM